MGHSPYELQSELLYGVCIGDCKCGSMIGARKGDTRSLDYVWPREALFLHASGI